MKNLKSLLIALLILPLAFVVTACSPTPDPDDPDSAKVENGTYVLVSMTIGEVELSFDDDEALIASFKEVMKAQFKMSFTYDDEEDLLVIIGEYLNEMEITLTGEETLEELEVYFDDMMTEFVDFMFIFIEYLSGTDLIAFIMEEIEAMSAIEITENSKMSIDIKEPCEEHGFLGFDDECEECEIVKKTVEFTLDDGVLTIENAEEVELEDAVVTYNNGKITIVDETAGITVVFQKVA